MDTIEIKDHFTNKFFNYLVSMIYIHNCEDKEAGLSGLKEYLESWIETEKKLSTNYFRQEMKKDSWWNKELYLESIEKFENGLDNSKKEITALFNLTYKKLLNETKDQNPSNNP